MTLKSHISLQDKIIQNLMKVLSQCNKSIEYRINVFQNIDKKLNKLKKVLDEHKFREIQSKLRSGGFYTKRAQALSLIEKLQSDLNKIKLSIKTMVAMKNGKLDKDSGSLISEKDKSGSSSLVGKFLGKIKVIRGGFL